MTRCDERKGEKHDWKLIECNNDIDTYKCTKCGHEFQESCSFDEEFS